MDASMAVDELVTLAAAYPQIRDFHYWAQLPGESVESGSARIQYLADKVIPEVTQKLSTRTQSVAGVSDRTDIVIYEPRFDRLVQTSCRGNGAQYLAAWCR
jgi:hypothetical protein